MFLFTLNIDKTCNQLVSGFIQQLIYIDYKIFTEQNFVAAVGSDVALCENEDIFSI